VDDYPVIRPKGRCYGNHLNLGDVCRHRHKRPLLFALAFDSGLADREAAFKVVNGNNPATSCTNLVNFPPIISEFMLLKPTIFAAIGPQFDDDFHSYLGVPKRTGRLPFDVRRVIGYHFCTSCRNLMRFGSVTPKWLVEKNNYLHTVLNNMTLLCTKYYQHLSMNVEDNLQQAKAVSFLSMTEKTHFGGS